MNAFLAANRGRIRTYFDRLVDVPDLSLREMRIEKYLRTLRTEAQQPFVAISLNELYFMHRLLLRPVHADVLKHAEAKQALHELTPPPDAKLSKEEDEELNVSLTGGLALSWEELADGAYTPPPHMVVCPLPSRSSSRSTPRRGPLERA